MTQNISITITSQSRSALRPRAIFPGTDQEKAVIIVLVFIFVKIDIDPHLTLYLPLLYVNGLIICTASNHVSPKEPAKSITIPNSLPSLFETTRLSLLKLQPKSSLPLFLFYFFLFFLHLSFFPSNLVLLHF